MVITVKSVTLTVCVLVTFLAYVNGTTSSLVLHNAPYVVQNQNSVFNCTSEGDGPDPTLTWVVKSTDTTGNTGTNIVNAQMSSQYISGTQDTADGVVTSSVTLLILQSYICTTCGFTYRLFCEAYDSGNTNPTLSIYTTLTGTSVDLGTACSSNSDCSIASSFCNTGESPNRCRCNSGYYDSNGDNTAGGSCNQAANLGGTCSANRDESCGTTNAVCSQTFTCVCSSGYVQSNGQCVASSATLDGACTSPTRTCPTNAVCGSGNVCVCNTGYTRSGNTCVQPSLGQSCTVSVGCQSTTSAGSTTQAVSCINNACSCSSSYYALNNGCYQKHGLGATCTASVGNSCSATYASCTGTGTPTCQCNNGYIQSGSTCVFDSSSSTCPAGSDSASTVTGVTGSASTPSVRVSQTCYSVNLQSTQVMGCSDVKQAAALRTARWFKLPNTVVVASAVNGGSYINGDAQNPSLTVSSSPGSFAGSYICQLCYADNYARCTNSSTVTLYVTGTAITSVSMSMSPSTTPTKGDQVTLTCNETPANVATSYVFYKGGTQIQSSTSATYTYPFASASNSGQFSCSASNTYGTLTSSSVTMNVQYAPEFSLTGGGTTETVEWNFDNGDVTLTCAMSANPAITKYYFYDGNNNLLTNPWTTASTYTVTSNLGYQTYSCRAENAIALSSSLYFDVVEESTANTGAATEDTGLSTGTIAAIVLGIIFFLLLLIILIVCCCNYGWCRKKEKVEPQPPPPAAKPYIPRTIVSANSTVTRKDVGIMMNGHHDVSVSTDFEEPRYTTPRYHLKPAKDSGPIISMFDDGYEQPRAHQLPALDTQYLYTDEEPRKRHKKKKRRRHHEHRETSPRRHHYEPEPVNLPPSDEDLVVVPGKQNYFE